MTAWPKKAQIIADFINCTIASSAVTIVIFQVQNHVVMLRYVIATSLDVAHIRQCPPSLGLFSGQILPGSDITLLFFLLPKGFPTLDFNDAWQWWVMHAPQRQETRV